MMIAPISYTPPTRHHDVVGVYFGRAEGTPVQSNKRHWLSQTGFATEESYRVELKPVAPFDRETPTSSHTGFDVTPSTQPDWPHYLQADEDRLRKLTYGWDGDRAMTISRFALYTATRITRRALEGQRGVLPPQIVPVGHGGVQVEWHAKRGELELYVEPDGELSIWGQDHLSGEEFTGEGEAARTLFNRWAPRLATRSDHEADVQVQKAIPIRQLAA